MSEPFRKCTTRPQRGLLVAVETPDGWLSLAVPGAFQVRMRETTAQPFLIFQPPSGRPRRGDLRSVLTPPAPPLAPPAEDSPDAAGQMASFRYADGTVLEFHMPLAVGTGGGEGFNGAKEPSFVLRKGQTVLNQGPIVIPKTRKP